MEEDIHWQVLYEQRGQREHFFPMGSGYQAVEEGYSSLLKC